jgi:hypothetical protein
MLEEIAAEGIEDKKRKILGEKSPEKELEDLSDPRLAKEWEFPFTFTNKRGEKFEGLFTNSIPNIDERTVIANLRASMTGGNPWESLSNVDANMIFKLAHVTVSLKKRAKWAKDLGKLDDTEIIDALYAKAMEHEAIFRGLRTPEEDSQGESKDG